MSTPVLAALLATSACEPPQPAAPAAQESSKMELSIGETEVATVGTWRVALAKTWEEDRAGAKVRVAWLSVVEKGSTAGATDVELIVGAPLTLGPRRFQVTKIEVSPAGDGSVALREQ